MKSDHEKRKELTDFYMWMVDNDYNHNIRIRVENKAEIYLRELSQANGAEKSDSNCNIPIVVKSVCSACSGSGYYCGKPCGACDGTGCNID